MGKLGFSLGMALLLGTVGCGDGSHPGNLPGGFGGGGGIVGSGGGSSGGSGGTAGANCEPDPTKGSVIQGDLVLLDALLMAPVSYHGYAHLVMDGTPCGYAIAAYDGTVDPTENFVLEGVSPLPFNWMRAYQDDGGTEDVMITLRVVNTQKDATVIGQFGFARASEIEAIYTSAGVTRDPTRATVLVQVIDGKFHTGYPGAEVSTLTDAVVAYPSGSGWSLGGQTDLAGVSALLNVEAEDFPGSSIGVHLVAGGQPQDFSTAVQLNAVSIITFAVGF
jgi:hypothetical protein